MNCGAKHKNKFVFVCVNLCLIIGLLSSTGTARLPAKYPLPHGRGSVFYIIFLLSSSVLLAIE